jgi:hypothetical protein
VAHRREAGSEFVLHFQNQIPQPPLVGKIGFAYQAQGEIQRGRGFFVKALEAVDKPVAAGKV